MSYHIDVSVPSIARGIFFAGGGGGGGGGGGTLSGRLTECFMWMQGAHVL